MKAATARLGRERAREVLANVESVVASSEGRAARDSLVKLLNSSVPTYAWVGIYLVQGNDLVLDAWAGPAATSHVRIPIGKGVCGYAAKSGRTEIVSDVGRDSRYLECFTSTRAEIVVPILYGGKVIGEIDIDSDQLDAFTTLDREFLEAVAKKVSAKCAL